MPALPTPVAYTIPKMLWPFGSRKVKIKRRAPRAQPAHSPIKPMHHMFLNADVLILIAHHLENTCDHVAFAVTSRWCYTILRKTIYTHVILRPDGPSFTIMSRLLNNPALCTHIAELDIVLSTRPEHSGYVPGRDDIQQMWERRDAFVQDAQTILKRTTQLKRLSIEEGKGEPLRGQLSLELGRGDIPFSLTSLNLGRTAPGVVGFIEAHPELNRLILTQRNNHPHDPENWQLGFSPRGDTLLKLRILWASPWWMRALLMRSPVRTFGLVHKMNPIDYLVQLNAPTELTMIVGLLSALGNIGGHPTVRCLALPWNDFIMPSTPLSLRILSKAFPRTQKLAVTLEPGQGFSSEVLISTVQGHFQAMGANTVFQSAREFCFLLPGEWPHENESNRPTEITKLGKDRDHSIPHALLKLMPGLVHVDTPDTCYSRVGAGVKHPGYGYRLGPLGGHDPVSVYGDRIRKGEWHGEFFFNVHIRQDDIVWFGRPRSKCPVSREWV